MITIYSVPECPYCNQLKEIITKEGISYRDVNVLLTENKEEYEQVINKTQSDEVPIVKIGNQLLVPNVSFTSITEAAELTKKFLG